MFYWTPVKYGISHTCVVCGNLYKSGYLSIAGEFYCPKDKNAKDATDFSIGRISIWNRQDLPQALLAVVINVLVDKNAKHIEWFALVPLEVVSETNSILSVFRVIQAIPSSYGMIYALSQ